MLPSDTSFSVAGLAMPPWTIPMLWTRECGSANRSMFSSEPFEVKIYVVHTVALEDLLVLERVSETRCPQVPS